MRRDGDGKQETKPCDAREPWLTKSARGGQEPEAQLAPCHGAPQQEVNKGLCLCAPLVYLSREGKQGAPYSSRDLRINGPNKYKYLLPIHGSMKQSL
jgi:hypothetical protein